MWYNTIIAWILRSPFHRAISRHMLLITVVGRKSGRLYTLPVSYIQVDNRLLVVSYRHRTWWRNVRNHGTVRACVAGNDVTAHVVLHVDAADVTTALFAFLEHAPAYARYFGIALADNGRLSFEAVAHAAQTRVVVELVPSASVTDHSFSE